MFSQVRSVIERCRMAWDFIQKFRLRVAVPTALIQIYKYLLKEDST